MYPHAHVELNFFRVFAWDGELAGHDGQAFAWQRPGRFTVAPLLPANTRILRGARAARGLRHHLCRGQRRGRLSSRARAVRSSGGLRLVQLRDKTWPLRAPRCALARPPGAARPSVRRARALERQRRGCAGCLACDGVHWPAAALLRQAARDRATCSSRRRATPRDGARTRRDARPRFRGAGAGRADADAPGCRAARLGTASPQLTQARACRHSRWAGSARTTSPRRSTRGAHGVALRRGALANSLALSVGSSAARPASPRLGRIDGTMR